MNGSNLNGTPPPSLRRRLLRLISLATLLTWLLAAGLSYRQARHEVNEIMDAHMAQTASLLLVQASAVSGHAVDLPDLMSSLRGLGKHDKRLVTEFLISRADGTVLVRSPRAPDISSSPDSASRALDPPGFGRLTLGNERWRSLVVVTANGGLRIQMLQAQTQRDIEALEIAVKTLLPLLLMLPLLLTLIYLAIWRSLKPLNALASEVGQRSPENLQAVSALADTPAEVVPLVSALNRLLTRVAQSLDNERRFTADAAHELRTPLAAIRVQAQVALASTDSEAHRHALNQVAAGTQRATRLVEQLLRLARLDPLASLDEATPVALEQIARATLGELLATTPERSEDIQFEAPDGALQVSGDAQLLGVALRNLLENALRHTRPGDRITLFAGLDLGAPVLGVRDTGPGVPAQELPKLIERFYRGKDSTGNEGSTSHEGSGLGLAIVRRIAQLHGAHLEVANIEGGGFSARLRWDVARQR